MTTILQTNGRTKVKALSDALNASVLGYHDQIETIICTLLAGGHVSALGEPGTAKTLTMRAVAWCIGDATYHREQLVPDTMPADLLGTNVYIKEKSKFRFRYGPLNPTVNLFHADEINRTTPKTQSALLQAMEEGQISTPRGVKSLHEVFMLRSSTGSRSNCTTTACPRSLSSTSWPRRRSTGTGSTPRSRASFR
jgi:MoxR-like ATPase